MIDYAKHSYLMIVLVAVGTLLLLAGDAGSGVSCVGRRLHDDDGLDVGPGQHGRHPTGPEDGADDDSLPEAHR